MNAGRFDLATPALVSPLALHGWLRANRQGGPTPVETCAAVQVMLDPRESVLALVSEGSRLDRHLSGTVPASRLFRYLLPEPSTMPDLTLRGSVWRSDAPAIELGAQDRDIAAGLPMPWPAPPPEPARRLRRIDSLHERDRIGLLVAESPEAFFAAIAGAAETLRAAPPAIVLDLAAVPPAERPALLERAMAAVAGSGLVWHDGILLPFADAPSWSERLLLLADRVACALPLRFVPELPAPPPAGQEVLVTLAWRGWESPVRKDDARRAGIEVDFDDAMPCAGFHHAETDGARWWRWTGPSRRAALALPVPDAGRWALRLDVFAWGAMRDAADLQVFADGRPLEPMPTPEAPLRFGVIAVPQTMPAGRVRIDLVCRSPSRAGEADARQVGICLTRAALERLG